MVSVKYTFKCIGILSKIIRPKITKKPKTNSIFHSGNGNHLKRMKAREE